MEEDIDKNSFLFVKIANRYFKNAKKPPVFEQGAFAYSFIRSVFAY